MVKDKPHAGDVIAKRLKELGKPQAWLKDQLGVSHNAVSLWVRTGVISFPNAKKVAEVLQIPAASLMGEETAQEEFKPAESLVSSHSESSMILGYMTLEEQELLRVWRETDETGRNVIRAVASNVPRKHVKTEPTAESEES